MPLGGSKDKTAARKNLSSVIPALRSWPLGLGPSLFSLCPLLFPFRNSQSEIEWLPTAFPLLLSAHCSAALRSLLLALRRSPFALSFVRHSPIRNPQSAIDWGLG
jgi:hypothetical protein